jgi:hypothetical protein
LDDAAVQFSAGSRIPAEGFSRIAVKIIADFTGQGEDRIPDVNNLIVTGVRNIGFGNNAAGAEGDGNDRNKCNGKQL